jgi:hypothetical protein
MISLMHRTIVIMLALAATGMLLAGCGRSTHASSISAPVGAGKLISTAQAVAYAHAVNLKPADLPGMSVQSPEGDAPAGPLRGEAARCAGAVNPDLAVAKIRSANFSGAAHELIRSAVIVWPSVALATRNQAVGRSRRALLCAQRLISREFAQRIGVKSHVGQVRVSRLAPLPGVPGSVGIRIKTSILGAHAGSDYVDAGAFVYGRSIITLYATGILQPVPEATESRLLSLLYTRAEAHKLS